MRHPRLALLGLCLCLLAMPLPQPAAAAGGPGDHVMIRFIGDFSGQVSFPDGHTEYITSLLAGTPQPPSHVNRRMHQLTLLLNILAKQGYEFEGTDGQNKDDIQIFVLRKVR